MIRLCAQRHRKERSVRKGGRTFRSGWTEYGQLEENSEATRRIEPRVMPGLFIFRRTRVLPVVLFQILLEHGDNALAMAMPGPFGTSPLVLSDGQERHAHYCDKKPKSCKSFHRLSPR